MRQFWALTLVQLRALLSSAFNRRRGRKRRSVSGPLFLGLVALVTVAISAFYSFSLGAAFAAEGVPDLILVFMPLLASFFTVVLGSQGAGTFVFGGRDTELLLSLPISTRLLTAAKLAAVGLENLLFVLACIVPAGVAYALFAGGVPVWFWPALLLGGVLLALVTTTLSMLIGLAVTLLRSRSPHKLVTNLVSLLLFVALMAVWVVGNNALTSQLRHDPARIRGVVLTWLPPLAWLRSVLVDGDPLALALLAAVAVLPLAALVVVLGRTFVPLVSRLSARHAASRSADLSTLRVRTPFAALVSRELRRFFGVTVFFVNAGFGLGLILLAAGYVAVVRQLAGLDVVADVTHTSPALLLGLLAAFFLTTVNTTAPSMALEGDRLWILRTSPLPTATVLWSKVAFHLVLTVPVALLAAAIVATALRLGVGGGLVIAGIAASAALATGLIGLLAALAWPNLDAPNETAAVKQGVSVVAGMFAGVALVALAAFAAFVASGAAGPGAGVAAAMAVLLAVSAALTVLLHTWGVRTFAALA